jgi:glucokinase
MKNAAVGVDIGGTNSTFGIVGQNGFVYGKSQIPTPAHGDAERFLDDLSTAIHALTEEIRFQQPDLEVLGVGVGAPNANYYLGTIEHAPNLSFKGIIPLKKMLETRFSDYPYIAVTKDANAAAMGEMLYGGAKGMKNFALFTLGTGVGSGLVVNGRIVYGQDGFAGECGHSTLFPGGRACGCGGQGHLEAYCSASGIKRTAFELIARDNALKSVLASYSFQELSARIIYEAAVNGDVLAQEVFEKTGTWLGIALADTVNHLSPEAIFLFGGPTAAGELLFKPARESMEHHLLPIFKNKVKLLPSLLAEGDAAIVGASALVWMEQKLTK